LAEKCGEKLFSQAAALFLIPLKRRVNFLDGFRSKVDRKVIAAA
jgi:hypothetical protein